MRSFLRCIRYVIGVFATIVFVVLLGMTAVSTLSKPVTAKLNIIEQRAYSQNDILFYSGCINGKKSQIEPYNETTVPGGEMDETLADMVEQYGELAMGLQREWGTPWEVVFAWMYNSGNMSEDVAIEETIEKWMGSQTMRSGKYDEAFSKLDPDNYDLRGFLDKVISIDSKGGASGGNGMGDLTSLLFVIDNTVKEVSKKKGWPSSEELAKQDNIGIGGKHPITTGSGGEGGGEASSDESGGSQGGSNGSCVKLTSSPNYNSAGYQGRMSNLHEFSQASGYFAGDSICGFAIKSTACGVMSAYAAFYMFSGQGLDDAEVFGGFKEAATSDGYYNCSAGEVYFQQYNQNGNLTAFTQMSGTVMYSEGVYSGDHWDYLVSELQKGNKVVINTSTEGGFPTQFTGGGHFMLLDHYDANLDMIYVFDPSMGYEGGKLSNVASVVGASAVQYDGDPRNGFYISRLGMDKTIGPRYALSLSYDGCWNDSMISSSGGPSDCNDGSSASAGSSVISGDGYSDNASVKAAYDALDDVSVEEVDALIKEVLGITDTDVVWFAAQYEASPAWYIGQFGDYLFSYYGIATYLREVRDNGAEGEINRFLSWGGGYTKSLISSVASQARNDAMTRKILYVTLKNPRFDLIGFCGADDIEGTSSYGFTTAWPHAPNSDGGEYRLNMAGQNIYAYYAQ